jgi:hypothetical protein
MWNYAQAEARLGVMLPATTVSPRPSWTRLSLAKQSLIETTTVGELVRVGKVAKVLRDAAKAAECAREAQQEAGSIHVWSFFRIGDILATIERQGDRKKIPVGIIFRDCGIFGYYADNPKPREPGVSDGRSCRRS